MILLIIPIIGVAVIFYGRVIKNLSKEVQDALADVLYSLPRLGSLVVLPPLGFAQGKRLWSCSGVWVKVKVRFG
jgi:ABC-type multidrug transport system fused ATPase/permease subunit